MAEPDHRSLVASFYDKWATPYTGLARYAPYVGTFRRKAVTGLALEAGDTAVDMGCGPGVNLPLLADAVGPTGTVLGVDVSPRMLEFADDEADPAISLALGDATRPPVASGVDGVLSTFVVTLFDDPEAVVDTWWNMLAPGGRLALLNLAPARGPFADPINWALEQGLVVWTPDADRREKPLTKVLDRRVTAAHQALADRADRVFYRDGLDGTLRLAVGIRSVESA